MQRRSLKWLLYPMMTPKTSNSETVSIRGFGSRSHHPISQQRFDHAHQNVRSSFMAILKLSQSRFNFIWEFTCYFSSTNRSGFFTDIYAASSTSALKSKEYNPVKHSLDARTFSSSSTNCYKTSFCAKTCWIFCAQAKWWEMYGHLIDLESLTKSLAFHLQRSADIEVVKYTTYTISSFIASKLCSDLSSQIVWRRLREIWSGREITKLTFFLEHVKAPLYLNHSWVLNNCGGPIHDQRGQELDV